MVPPDDKPTPAAEPIKEAAKPAAVVPPSEDELRERETAKFIKAEDLPAHRAKEAEAISAANAKPAKAEEGKTGADDDGGDGNDKKAAAKPADGGADADKAKADDKAKEGEDEEQLPEFLTERIKRVAAKEKRVDDRESAEQQRIRELEEKNAELEARVAAKSVEKAEAPVKPKSSDFDSAEEYEEARDEYDTKLAAFTEAKAKAPKAEEKPATAGPKLPLGITAAELKTGIDTIIANVPKEIADALGDEKKTPVLPATVILHIAGEKKDRAAEMGKYASTAPKTMKAISELPAREQAAAFEKAFSERPKAKVKSDAPDPIDRVNGGNAGLGAASYKDFEKQRNAEELAERGSYH